MKIEEKSKRKRSVSVLTVFIWLAMIVVMTTITINGIKENHAIEGDNSILRIKVKVSGLDTEEVRKRYENLDIKVIDSIINPVELLKFDFVGQDSEGNYIYEINRDELENKLNENNIKYGYYIVFDKEDMDGYAQIITSENLYEASYKICSDYISRNSDVDYNVDIQYVEEAKIKINLKIDGIEDKDIKESIYEKVGVIYLADLYYDSNRYIENGNEIIEYSKVVPDIEGAIYTSNSLIRAVRVNEYNAMVAYEINEEKYYGGVDFVTPNSGEELVIDVTIYYTKGDTRANKSAKWIDKNTGMVQIELGYTSTGNDETSLESIDLKNGHLIYQDIVSNEFELSPEYENNSKWSILETTGNEIYEGILKDVYDQFYVIDEDRYTGKEYVYVKDTRTIYWLEDKVKMKEGSTNINVIYTGYENLVDEEVLESNQEAILFYYGDNIEKYKIATPNLKFSHIAEAFIKINKEVKGEKGNNTYYVGLFKDEASNNTDQIYKIDTVDGKGNITIELDDKEKVYYIYEVDENGNKLTDESINYNKNKVEFNSYVRDAKITTDSSVVSSVVSDYYDEEDDSKWKQDEEGNWYFETDVNGTIGAGKANYIDNVLSVRDIYQEDIMISSEEIKYKVIYVPEEGGSIEGETEESVNPGETPESVPTPKADEGYEFVRWEVEENGERVKVDPKEYIIEKDTVFYAIFEKIPVENPVDTSDIHVGVYIIISLVAIVGIVSVVYYSIRTKKNKVNK